MQAPLFGTLDALAVDDGGGRAGLAARLLAAGKIGRVVDALQRAAPLPQPQAVVRRAVRRQVLRYGASLAAGAEHIHQPVDHFAQVDCAPASAPLARRNAGLNHRHSASVTSLG